MKKRIKVSVIGVGHLGYHHARVLKSMKGVDLVSICDNDRNNRGKACRDFKVIGVSDYRDVVGDVDCVSIAVPTVNHYQLAKYFLNSGKDIFIEKPICTTVSQAKKLIELARENRKILQVGHIERFNPAMLAAEKYIKKPLFIESHRISAFKTRVKDIGVVLDLMVHDIDIILQLTGSKIKKIDATGIPVLTGFEDIANARIVFESGCIANITVSRISFKNMRKLRIFQKNAYISVDFTGPEVDIFEKKGKEINRVDCRIVKTEPLFNELESFISTVRNRRKPKVTGEHGKNALEIAVKVTRMIKGTRR